jgi:hypothetical protein
MDEEDLISEPAENLPQYDATDSSYGEETASNKNPGETEAFFVVLMLGVLPDVIDFFSIGALSFLSSALSWPITEYYFSQKNLKVPNIRKWIRGTNLGDVIPFLGALPLKTIGLLVAIHIAWHPESKIAKGAQALEAATSAKEALKKPPTGGELKQKPKGGISDVGRKTAGIEELGQEKAGAGKDIYEEIREGAGGVMGPEEQAEKETFGEIISFPENQNPAEEPMRSEVAQKKPPTEKAGLKPNSETSLAKESTEKIERAEEIESRLGIGEVEREIKEKLTSPEAVMEDQGIPTFNNGRGVDLRTRGDK